MSKYVKNLIADHLRQRLESVNDALLVNVIGLDANANNRLRTELTSKDINLMVVKNSLAARATAGTSLGPMFEGLTGTSAICWGSEDIVSLAKEVVRLAREDEYEAMLVRQGPPGAAMFPCPSLRCAPAPTMEQDDDGCRRPSRSRDALWDVDTEEPVYLLPSNRHPGNRRRPRQRHAAPNDQDNRAQQEQPHAGPREPPCPPNALCHDHHPTAPRTGSAQPQSRRLAAAPVCPPTMTYGQLLDCGKALWVVLFVSSASVMASLGSAVIDV